MNKEKTQLEEAKNTLIGRIFTLGGSALFLIGSFIAVVVAFQSYNRLANE